MAVAVQADRADTGEAQVSLEERQFVRNWRRFRKRKRGIVGLTTLTLIVLGIIFIPVFSPFSYNDLNVMQLLAPAGTVSVDAGIDVQAGHLYVLGTDESGRDLLTRLFYGGRITLSVALMSAILVMIIGAILGALAGTFGGIVDSVIMRVTDLMMAFPLVPTFLLLTKLFPIGAQFSGQGGTVEDLFQTASQAFQAALGYALIFVVLGWMPIARQVRASILYLRTLEYVEAARALGAGGLRILRKHLIPNSIAPIIISGVLALGDFIIYESILSYLGMGVNNPVPSWGNMIRDGEGQMWYIGQNLNPFQDIRGYLVLFPGILVLLTVLSINLIADALRDTLSPQ